jgi:hypothetical protein
MGLEQLSWLAPSRWGLAAAASTIDLNNLQPAVPGQSPDTLWDHSSGTWLIDMGVLVGLGLAFLIIAWWRLERLRPGRKARL